MATIDQVRDRLQTVESGIAGIETISAAVAQSRDYITQSHPEVKPDLAAMCVEMRKTLGAVAVALSIVPHLRACVTPPAGDALRFAEQLDIHRDHARSIETPLNALRGHCGVIADHAARIKPRAAGTGWRDLAQLLSFNSNKFEKEINDALEGIYNDEMQFHHNVFGLRHALEDALSDVRTEIDARGPLTAMDLLASYAEPFNRVQVDANYTAIELQETITALT